jgi:hypothetical protein
VTATLGALLAIFAFVFRRLDRRGAQFVKLAEDALVAGEACCVPDYARVFSLEHAGTPAGTWTFGRSFRLIFAVMAIAGLGACLFSIYRIATWGVTWPAHAVSDQAARPDQEKTRLSLLISWLEPKVYSKVGGLWHCHSELWETQIVHSACPLTPREYRALQKHIEGSMPQYRLRVETGALSSKPKLTVFRFDQAKQRGIDDRAGKIVNPGFSPVQAAIVSLG